MFGPSFKIAAVWGIPIKVDLSIVLTLAVVLIEYGKYGSQFALVLAAGLFASIALHELGHAWVARLKRCRVRQIFLTCIGGVAEMDRLPHGPLDEFLMTAVGPAVSLALGAACLAGSRFVPPTPLRGLLYILGWINLWLAAFNLLPAFPMDGGRILRSLLTPRMGRLKATYVAARLGKFLAVAGGLLALATGHRFAVVIALFVYLSARREYRAVQLEETMDWHGFSLWPPPPSDDAPPPRRDDEPGDDADQVTISPPPYRGGPNSKAPIRTEDDNPFNKLFDR